MQHESQLVSAQNEENGSFYYDPCFQYVQSSIQSADLSIGNLEVTLPGSPPYLGSPRFRCPDAYAVAMKNAGFDLLTTANNHCNDSGPEGLIQTLNTLDDLHLMHLGTYRNQDERDSNYPLLVEVKGFKLAFLNYTYGTNRIQTVPPTVVNLTDIQQIEKDMQAARDLKPDAIIVIMHWGREYHIFQSPYQNKLADQLFEWGALMVIGAHPHVLQPIKQKTMGGKKRLVAYSLGNFISGQTKPHTDCSVMFNVELGKASEEQAAVIKSHHYIPVWRWVQKKEKAKEVYTILPDSHLGKKELQHLQMPPEDRKAFRKAINWIRSHLSN